MGFVSINVSYVSALHAILLSSHSCEFQHTMQRKYCQVDCPSRHWRRWRPASRSPVHYNDVIMSAMASQIISLTIVYSTVYSGADQRKQAPRHWSLWGEFTGDRWIPLTKGQSLGKCFHLMTSSWTTRAVILTTFPFLWYVYLFYALLSWSCISNSLFCQYDHCPVISGWCWLGWKLLDMMRYHFTWCPRYLKHYDGITWTHSALTHWGRDKMDAISQTIFSNAFCWMKMLEYRLKFNWSLFLRVQLTISKHCFR